MPSWVNEKVPGVSVNRAVWFPATFGLVLKVLTGLLGGWGFVHLADTDSDIVQLLLGSYFPEVTQYAAYLWDITTMIPGIPPPSPVGPGHYGEADTGWAGRGRLGSGLGGPSGVRAASGVLGGALWCSAASGGLLAAGGLLAIERHARAGKKPHTLRTLQIESK